MISSTPGELIDVGGYKLHLRCEGVAPPGVPTLIIETGIWDCSESWRQVQPELAKITRVCSYDRAGYGWSEQGPSPRTFDRMVKELKTLLEKKKIQPPYIFIGHSLGGPIARYFHSQYPDEVSGIVFVDALHLRPPEFSRLFRIMTIVIYCLAHLGFLRLLPLMDHQAKVSAMKTCFAEWDGNEESFRQLREGRKPLNGIPVTYIYGMHGTSQEQEREEVPHARFVMAQNSRHMVQIDRPDVIIDEVRRMLNIPLVLRCLRQ